MSQRASRRGVLGVARDRLGAGLSEALSRVAVWSAALADAVAPIAHAEVPPEESRGDGPPAHWVEKVRRGAPHLLESLQLDTRSPALDEDGLAAARPGTEVAVPPPWPATTRVLEHPGVGRPRADSTRRRSALPPSGPGAEDPVAPAPPALPTATSLRRGQAGADPDRVPSDAIKMRPRRGRPPSREAGELPQPGFAGRSSDTNLDRNPTPEGRGCAAPRPALRPVPARSSRRAGPDSLPSHGSELPSHLALTAREPSVAVASPMPTPAIHEAAMPSLPSLPPARGASLPGKPARPESPRPPPFRLAAPRPALAQDALACARDHARILPGRLDRVDVVREPPPARAARPPSDAAAAGGLVSAAPAWPTLLPEADPDAVVGRLRAELVERARRDRLLAEQRGE